MKLIQAGIIPTFADAAVDTNLYRITEAGDTRYTEADDSRILENPAYFTRVTEAGDTRYTEAGDDRVTDTPNG